MKRKILFVLCLAFFFAGCPEKDQVSPETVRRRAGGEIERWHRLYNEKKFGEIAAQMIDPVTLPVKGEKDLVELLERQHDAYGKAVHSVFSSQTQTARHPETGSRETTLIYKTQFEKVARFEIFVFFVGGQTGDERLKLVSYRVNTGLGHAEFVY